MGELVRALCVLLGMVSCVCVCVCVLLGMGMVSCVCVLAGKHRKHPGGRGNAGGQHHHRINFDKL